jgi:hypothetical protein
MNDQFSQPYKIGSARCTFHASDCFVDNAHYGESIILMGGGGWFYVPKVGSWCINGCIPSQAVAVDKTSATSRSTIETINNVTHSFRIHCCCCDSCRWQVWAPSGGWWCNPPHWKRDTAIAGLVAFGICAALFKVSAEREVRPRLPRGPIPSQMWCKHAPGTQP